VPFSLSGSMTKIKQSHAGKVDNIVLSFSSSVRRTEIPMLPHNLPKSISLILRPPQHKFSCTMDFGFIERKTDAPESLRLVKDHPNRLDARLSGTPAFLIPP